MCDKSGKVNYQQNLLTKLELKDSIPNIHLIQSQPHSSKGNEQKKRENVQDYNNMKKKLFSMLGKHSESSKAFTISPTNSIKQQYFVSTSIQQKTKSVYPKQNNTLDWNTNLYKNEIRSSAQNLQSQLQKEWENKHASQDRDNLKNKKLLCNSKQVSKIKPDSISRNLHTDRHFLLALFEKLNGKETAKHRRQTSQNSNYGGDSQKESMEREYNNLKHRQKQKGSMSNNTSGQFCSEVNLNSSSTQIQQNHKSCIDDNVAQIVIRTKNILRHYSDKLKQVNFEKEMLVQEIQYWKSKYQNCKLQTQLS